MIMYLVGVKTMPFTFWVTTCQILTELSNIRRIYLAKDNWNVLAAVKYTSVVYWKILIVSFISQYFAFFNTL